MGRITSGVGLVSGINSRDIIDQLMSLESRPKTQLQDRIDATNERKLAYTDLSTRLSGLKLTGTALKKPSTFQAATTTSSDEDVLTATAANGAAVGTYQFQVARMVTTQQAVSAGFTDINTAKIGAGTLTIEQSGGDLTSQTTLSQLNGGTGIRRGLFRITDRSGNTAVIDTTAAVTLDDVVKKINTALSVSVRASLDGDRVVLTDLTGKTTSNFIVQDLGDGRAAADLGLVADASANTINGTDVNSIGAATLLDQVNDGRGVRKVASGADFRVTVSDGTTFDITVGASKTVGDILTAINTAGGAKLRADVASGANGIRLTDTSGGGGSFTVTALNSSQAASDLGIQTTGAGGVINGSAVIAGLNTVLLSSLKGGSGIPLGQITITDRAGGNATVDLSGARTVQDVLNAINNAGGINITASLKASANGIQIIDDSGGSGNLVIADSGSTTAAALGIAGTFDTTKAGAIGANLQRKWVTENSALATYNGGKSVAPGSFVITNSAGVSATVELTQGVETTLGDVINAINAKGINVTASVNANGDGLLLTDTAGGASKLKVEEDDSTTAADLNIKGTATATTIDGSFEKTIAVDAADTLTTLQQKINDLGFGASASIINDGSGLAPFRLSLNARNSGRSGRVVFDGGETKAQTQNLVEAQDAAVFLGSADAAQPLLVTAGSNQLTGLVKGVTIDLHGVSDRPITLSVTRTADPLVEQLTKFTEDFNALVDKMDELTKFDTETNERGLLLGETTVQTIEAQIYTIFTASVSSGGRYRVLADVGLKLGDGAKIEFDEEKFRAAFADNAEAVETLFAAPTPPLGRATLLNQLNDGDGIRKAAGGSPDFRVTLGDGTEADITLADAEDLGDVLDALNAASPAKLSAAVAADGSGLVLTDLSGATTNPFKVSLLNGSQAAVDLKITGNASNGVITGARLSAVQTSAAALANAGIGYRMEASITRLIDPVDGAITRENRTLDERTRQFQGRIDSLDKLLTKKRERLERQFAQLESVLSGLQSQQQALGSLSTLQTPSRAA